MRSWGWKGWNKTDFFKTFITWSIVFFLFHGLMYHYQMHFVDPKVTTEFTFFFFFKHNHGRSEVNFTFTVQLSFIRSDPLCSCCCQVVIDRSIMSDVTNWKRPTRQRSSHWLITGECLRNDTSCWNQPMKTKQLVQFHVSFADLGVLHVWK